MLGYLKNLYKGAIAVLSSKGAVVYPLLAKAALVVLSGLLVWAIFKRVMSRVRKRGQEHELIRVHEQVFVLIQRAMLYAIVFVSGIMILNIFKLPILEKVFYAILIILLAIPVRGFTLILLEYMQAAFVEKSKTKVDDILFELLNKFSGVIIFAIAIMLALDVLGINVMPFVAGAGVVGIAVGFAAKDTLSTLIAGILLIIDRPFEMGDRIEVWSAPKNSATWGDVIDIGLRATKIRTTDNIVIVIPNNEIMKRDIVNYTALSEDIRVRIPIGVSYDTDIEKAKAAILGVAETADWVLKDPPPKVDVRQFGASSVDLQLRVWIKDARKRMDTISYLTDKVKEAFDRQGIEIPYPKRDITVTQKG